MKKLINYVLNGEGLGAKYLLVLALVVSIIVSIMLRIGGSEAIPYAQSIADQMLPVKVQNGRVITPADTLKIASLQIDGASDPIALPVVIDTRTDTLDTTQLKDGIYLTRTTLYTVNRNQVKLVRLEGSFRTAPCRLPQNIQISSELVCRNFCRRGHSLLVCILLFADAFLRPLCQIYRLIGVTPLKL